MSNPRTTFRTDLPRRENAIASIDALGEVDVLVVGAGINGAAAFRDLGLQGVKAMIVDKLDFGAGASMASSRMAHGGLRYLENGEFRLTAEATRERNRLLQAAGHMIRPLPMAIPFFSLTAGLVTSVRRAFGSSAFLRERGFVMAEIGLFIYDWFARLNRSMPLHRAMFKRGASRVFPALHPAVRAVSIYYDAVIDAPERIPVELISEGLCHSPGSIALNHCSLVEVDGGAVVLRDEMSGRLMTVRPKIVLNATGAWIDVTNKAMGLDRQVMGGSKGSHIVIDHPGLFQALAGHGMIFDDGAGRVCIVYPMRDKVLLGATDIPVTNPDGANCSEEEQNYLLSAARVVFPKIAFGPEHVVYRFCGVRPLPKSDAVTPGAVSRDHSIVTFEPDAGRTFPVLCLVGGKWTTFRAFAAQVCDAALDRLGKARVTETSGLAVGGGAGMATPEGRRTLAKAIADRHAISESRAEALVGRYGTGAEAVASFIRGGEDAPLSGAPDFSDREIRWLVRQEMGASVDDIVFRRTTLAIEGRLSMPLLKRIEEIVREENGLDPTFAATQFALLVERLSKIHAVSGLREPTPNPIKQKTAEQNQ